MWSMVLRSSILERAENLESSTLTLKLIESKIIIYKYSKHGKMAVFELRSEKIEQKIRKNVQIYSFSP